VLEVAASSPATSASRRSVRPRGARPRHGRRGDAARHRDRRQVDGPLPPAYGDRRRHWQVLGNLLANAVRYSPPDRPPEVSITTSGDVLEVSVRDHGPGIRPEDEPRLFQRFSRIAASGDEAGPAPDSASTSPARWSRPRAGGSGWRARPARDRPSGSRSRSRAGASPERRRDRGDRRPPVHDTGQGTGARASRRRPGDRRRESRRTDASSSSTRTPASTRARSAAPSPRFTGPTTRTRTR
jgi:hypothetical protein